MYDVNFGKTVRKVRYKFYFWHYYKDYDHIKGEQVDRKYTNRHMIAELSTIGGDHIDMRVIEKILIRSIRENSCREGNGYYIFDDMSYEDVCAKIGVICCRELERDVEISLSGKDYSVSQFIKYKSVDVDKEYEGFKEREREELMKKVEEYKRQIEFDGDSVKEMGDDVEDVKEDEF